MEKYRTQRRIIFLPFLLHVQPSTKVCLSRDRICGGSHECIMYTEFLNLRSILFPVQWNPCLTPRIAKTIAITTELNNTFFSYIQFISVKLTPLPTCKNWKESTKTFIEKILSILPCLHCNSTSEQAMQAFLSFLHSPHVYENMYLFP